MRPDTQPTPGDELFTFFLPAGRAPREMVLRQAGMVGAQSLLTMLLDAIPEMLLILNPQRQIVFANQTLADVLGIGDLGEAIGSRPGEALDCAHAADTPGGCGTSKFCTTCGAARALQSASQGRADVQECRILRRNRTEALDFRVYAKPFELNGEPFTLFVLDDVSHEHRRRALERIFFHDVLNTAGGVFGAAQLLAMVDPQEQEELRAMVERLSRRLIDEIKAQRMLSDAESGDLKPLMQETDVEALADEVAELYRSHAVAKGREIEVAPPDGGGSRWITSDPNLLSRVMGNLVKNALEASSAGDMVTVSMSLLDDVVELRVHNPAVMPEPVQMQMFQRSFSTKGEGRGLGTYSIRLLTEKYLGGTVRFESAPGAGTTFFVRVPRARP